MKTTETIKECPVLKQIEEDTQRMNNSSDPLEKLMLHERIESNWEKLDRMSEGEV